MLPDQLGRFTFTAKRPDFYFEPDNPQWPAVATLTLAPPPVQLSEAQLREGFGSTPTGRAGTRRWFKPGVACSRSALARCFNPGEVEGLVADATRVRLPMSCFNPGEVADVL